ncbi:MAG: SoxR reducing system RseC family protein [Prevotella sp.]|nr:SoxR reducing system RseC family protein [Prevotella sp.]
MSNDIRHDGIIADIDGTHVSVRILQASACGACKIAGHCRASETKEKMVDVITADASRFKTGQAVVVSASYAVAQRALLLGFALPLLLMLIVLLTLLATGFSEQTAGLSALISLAPYYGVLSLMRDRVSRQVSFAIEPKE